MTHENTNTHVTSKGAHFGADSGATLYEDGRYIMWALNGVPHKDNGPAVIDRNGTEMWYHKGNLHRVCGPAAYGETRTGQTFQEWFLHGKHHRIDGPAIVRGEEEFWFFNGSETDNPELCEQATQPDGVAEKLIALCGHEDYVVRNLALNNPNCPEEGKVLHTLKYENG